MTDAMTFARLAQDKAPAKHRVFGDLRRGFSGRTTK